MTISKLLFSMEGRISRSTYWLKFYLPYIVILIITVVLDAVLGTVSEEAGIGAISGIFMLTAIYPSIAVSVKRAHDRGRSGLFILVFLVPIVGLWPAIELAFIKGTTGPNKYGDDPVA